MAWFTTLALDYAAPPFLVASPILSYGDQIYSIHKTKSSAGFSLDIPLVMLVASIFKIFYWFGAYYSIPLLLQAIAMIAVQMLLLKVALENRPPAGTKDGVEHAPFSGLGGISSRPYNFWQWKANRPYWTFLLYLTASLLVIHVLLPTVSRSEVYITFIGFVGLGVEAFLPIPQILANQRAHSSKGFRFSVLAAWLLGDSMKMSYFFFSGSAVPLAFRVCGVFQCMCDVFLGIQCWVFSTSAAPPSHSRHQSHAEANGVEGDNHLGMKDMDVRPD